MIYAHYDSYVERVSLKFTSSVTLQYSTASLGRKHKIGSGLTMQWQGRCTMIVVEVTILAYGLGVKMVKWLLSKSSPWRN